MSVATDLMRHYAEVRNRLRFPPNAVPDTGINLRRSREQKPSKELPKPPVAEKTITPIQKKQIEAYKTSFCRTDVTFRKILSLTAEEFGLDYKHLIRKTRVKKVVIPRQIACYLANKYIDQSLASMGRFLGQDHTSIIHGKNQVTKMMAINHPFCVKIKAIEDKIFACITRHSDSAIYQPTVAGLKRSCSQVPAVFPVDNSDGSASSVSEAWNQQDVAGELCSPITAIFEVSETIEGCG